VSDQPGISRPDERSDARERTLYLLYEASSKRIPPASALAVQVIEPDRLTQELVLGVEQHQGELDRLITESATGWKIERMPVLDVQVMRLAIYELLHRPEVPTAVILNEAVDLAKRYSTDDSGRFVNGVLAAVARQVRSA
jgi:transcription antitermination protein NusB